MTEFGGGNDACTAVFGGATLFEIHFVGPFDVVVIGGVGGCNGNEDMEMMILSNW